MDKEPVCDPDYWKERLGNCGGELHRAIFNGSITQFDPFNKEHQEILRKEINPTDSVLDAGCGYGRILGLMPSRWRGEYLGVDVSEDMLEIARKMYAGQYPRCQFRCMDLRYLAPYQKFDVAVVSSLKNMILRHRGEGDWLTIERVVHCLCDRVIYLTFGEWD